MKGSDAQLLSAVKRQEFELFATNRFLQDCALKGLDDDDLLLPLKNISDNPIIGEYVRNEGAASVYDYITNKRIIRYATLLTDGRVYLLTLRDMDETTTENGDRLKKAWSLFVDVVSVYGGLK